MKKVVVIVMSLILCLMIGQPVLACTILSVEKDGRILVGNNEDYMYSLASQYWIAAPENENYGRICFAISGYVQGGMNEKGLFYDGATCPDSTIPYEEGKPELGMDMGEVIISKCATVEEVIEFVKDYNITQQYTDHLLFADATGASVVIEWMENDMKIVRKEGDYQVATNFWLSNPELGGYPCNRYAKAEEMLQEDRDDITVNLVSDILEATAQSWNGGGTKYSNVYDLNNQEVVIYTRGDFSKYIKLSLVDELAKLKQGEITTFNIDNLFENNELVQDVSNLSNTNEKSITSAPRNTSALMKDEKESKLDTANMNTQTSNVEDNKMYVIYGIVLIITLTAIITLVVLYKRRSFGRKID